MPASVRPLVSSKSSYGVATVSRSDKIRARGGAPPRGHGMLPRAIRVGPNEGDTKIGGGSSGSLSGLIMQNPGFI